jgi:DNA-binding CsgD family transcriptional regulator
MVSRPVFRREILQELYSWVCDEPAQRTTLAVVIGHAAMGKSILLDNLGARVAAAGLPVCRLAGIESWRNRPYALIEQLAWPDGRTAIDADHLAVSRRHPDDAELLAEAAGLVSTAIRELSDSGRILVVIDDAQHVDDHSLACLRFAHHRVPSERLKVLCAYREGIDSHPSPALHDYLLLADAGRIELEALSAREIESVTTTGTTTGATIGAVTPATAMLYRDSGGNPLLVDLALFGPRWNPGHNKGSLQALHRAAALCVNRMGPTTTRLAHGVAVLGDACDLRLLSMLCQVNIAVAERAVEHLHEVGLLLDGTYRHPDAAAAIVRDIEPDDLLRLRIRAAQILADETNPQRAADQLLQAGTVPDEAQVALLRDAAERAITANDLFRAAHYLQLAHRFWPTHHLRHAISTRLAYLHWLLDPASSAPRINALVPTAMAGVLDPEHAFLAVCMTLWRLETDTAADIVNQHHVNQHHGDTTNDEPPQAGQVLLSSFSPGAALQRRDKPANANRPPTSPRHLAAKVRACKSLRRVLRGEHDDSIRALTEQTLLTHMDSPIEIPVIGCSLLTLVYGEWLDSANYWIRRIALDDRWQSVTHPRASSRNLGALIALRRGDLTDAVTQADQALTTLSDHHNLTACLATATYIEATALLGEHHEAGKACARPVPGQLFATVAGLHYLHARATYHLMVEQLGVSLTDFAATGDQMSRWGVDSPALAPWRLGAAQALIHLSEHEHAAQLLRQQLAAAIGRYPLVERTTRRLLAHNRAKLLTHTHPGTRHATDTDDAHPATSSRPNPEPTPADHRTRDTSTGQTIPAPRTETALSPAEQRVATLASRGLTNREIGAELHLTISTIEQHLTKIYRKLRIQTRGQLAHQIQAPDTVTEHANTQ